MKIRRMARASMAGSFAGLVAMLLLVFQTWHSLGEDLAEVRQLVAIENRSTELGIAVNYLLRFSSNPSLVSAVRRDIEQLNQQIDQLEHPGARPAKQHLSEVEQILVASLASNQRIAQVDSRSLALDMAAAQIGVHQMGFSAALKTIMTDRYEAIDASLHATLKTMAAVALLLAAFSLFGFLLILRCLTGPVRSFEEVIQAWRDGDLNARMPELADDELGHLAHSFNLMANTRQQHEEKIHAYQAELQHSLETLRDLAYHDQLTGLLSRDGFVDLVGKITSEQDSLGGYVVALNIMGMRDINQTHGYSQGDQLLREVGIRIEQWLPAGGLVGRVGGDEMSIYLPHAGGTVRGLASAAASIEQLFDAPFELTSGSLVIEVNFGLVQASGDAMGALRRAEIALFAVRRSAVGHWQVFTPAMERDTHERLTVTRELRQALDNQEFRLHYQPKVNLTTGKLVGGEALLRWQHPLRGLQVPGRFISVAEQSKLIIPIGVWALREACRQLKYWQVQGLSPVKIAVNVSLVQFLNTDLVATVRDVLQETGVAPEELSLEITESVFDQGGKRLLQQLISLRDMGVALALDDFGTGYSSLRYIREYPFSCIKLDRSFVDKVTEDAYSRAICEMVIRIGVELGIDIIAEGIETEQQALMLRSLGCNVGQGYYYARPLPPEAFCQMLESVVTPNRKSSSE